MFNNNFGQFANDFGQGQVWNNYDQSTYQNLNWLDYTCLNNPAGVMLVLSRYGYIGYLAPQDPQELREAAVILIQQQGDRAVVDLLKVHPDYEIIKDIPGDIQSKSFLTGFKFNIDPNLLILAGLVFIALKILK